MRQKRLLTWILLGAGGIAAIFAGLLVYVVLTFDVNDYKSQLSQLVTEQYQRTLTIDGDLSFSVFPNVEVTLPHTSLSEPNKKDIAAEVKEIHLELALMPLVRKEIKIGEVVLDGLKTVVIKDKAGKLNFDDLLGASKKTKSRERAEPTSPKEKMINFDVDGIRITNSAFTYRDLGTEKEIALTQVDFSVGRLAVRSTVPLEISFYCESKEPALKAKLTMNGKVFFDLTEKRYSADTLAVTFDGTVNDAPLAAQIDVAGFEWTAEAFKTQSLKVSTKRGGADSAEISLVLAGAHGSPSAIDVDQFTGVVRANTGATGQTIAIDIQSPLSANLDTQTITVKALDGRVKVVDPAAANQLIEMTIAGALDVDGKEEKVKGRISVAMDESNIDSRFDVVGFSKPAIQCDIDINTINVDRYTNQQSSSSSATDEAAQVAKEAPIDLSALKSFSLDGGVRLGALQIHGIKARDIAIKIILKNGQLSAAPLTAKLYEGVLDAKAFINANTNQFSFSPQLTAIQVGPLMRDAAKLDKMEGKGDVLLDLTAQGSTITNIKQSLAGKAAVQLVDGEIKGFDYGKRLAGWKDKLTNLGAIGTSNEGVASSDEKTVFSELSATFVINKGVATNNDLSVKAPLVRLGGNGSIDIGRDSLDYTVKASVVNTLTGQGGKDLGQAKDITIPVRVHGPFDTIAYRIQWTEVSSAALQSMVAPKIEEQKKVLQEKVQDKIKGSLQGLFGR